MRSPGWSGPNAGRNQGTREPEALPPALYRSVWTWHFCAVQLGQSRTRQSARSRCYALRARLYRCGDAHPSWWLRQRTVRSEPECRGRPQPRQHLEACACTVGAFYTDMRRMNETTNETTPALRAMTGLMYCLVRGGGG